MTKPTKKAWKPDPKSPYYNVDSYGRIDSLNWKYIFSAAAKQIRLLLKTLDHG